MNWDQVQGNWTEFKGKLRQQYGDLTDNEVEEAKGSQEEMIGLIQRKYGKTREDAKREIDNLSVA